MANLTTADIEQHFRSAVVKAEEIRLLQQENLRRAPQSAQAMHQFAQRWVDGVDNMHIIKPGLWKGNKLSVASSFNRASRDKLPEHNIILRIGRFAPVAFAAARLTDKIDVGAIVEEGYENKIVTTAFNMNDAERAQTHLVKTATEWLVAHRFVEDAMVEKILTNEL